jgi:hypothetical protein
LGGRRRRRRRRRRKQKVGKEEPRQMENSSEGTSNVGTLFRSS